MNHTAETIAANAIARSISHTEIVTLDDEGDLRTALLALCEDNVEANGVAEFWGTTDDGEEWRVHVRLGEPERTITIDPSDPFAGLVAPHDQGDVLAGWIREKGAERLAVELLSEASGAGCGTWDDDTRRALVRALEKIAETIATSVFRLTPKGERDFYAAGYEGNFFATREAAEGGIEALGPSSDWEIVEQSVSEYGRPEDLRLMRACGVRI